MINIMIYTTCCIMIIHDMHCIAWYMSHVTPWYILYMHNIIYAVLHHDIHNVYYMYHDIYMIYAAWDDVYHMCHMLKYMPFCTMVYILYAAMIYAMLCCIMEYRIYATCHDISHMLYHDTSIDDICHVTALKRSSTPWPQTESLINSDYWKYHV